MLIQGQTKEILIGDRIQFRVTSTNGDELVWRIVSGWWGANPTVQFQGWEAFIVDFEKIQVVDHGCG